MWPLVETAYAETLNPKVSLSTSTDVVQICGKVGVCLYVQKLIYIQSNSSSTLEIWQASNSGDWSVITFFKNSDIHLDFSKVQSEKLNILGQDINVKEHQAESNGKTSYILFGSIKQADGGDILLQVMSSKSILENNIIKSELSGQKVYHEETKASSNYIDNIYKFIASISITVWAIVALLLSIFAVTIIYLGRKTDSTSNQL